MTRPNFSTVVRTYGTRYTNTNPSGSTVSVADGMTASEAVVGVHRRKPTGWIPPTDYSLLRKVTRKPYGSLYYRPTASSWERTVGALLRAENILDDWNSIEGSSDPSINSELQDRALIRARNALKDARVNLGQAWLERDMTIRLVGDTATQLYKSARALKKGDWQASLAILGIKKRRRKSFFGYTKDQRPKGSSFPQRWLELQYGWRPLLQDIHGAVSALESRSERDWRVTAKGSAKLDNTKRSIYWPVGGSNIPAQHTASTTQSCFVRIDALPDKEHIASLASLGITNPLLLAWELTPFSFVADWMLPVGDWLSSLDAMFGYDEDNTYTSITHLARKRISTVGLPSAVWPTVEFGPCFRDRLLVKRTATIGVPMPVRPHFKNPASLTHMANALSLLTQIFR